MDLANLIPGHRVCEYMLALSPHEDLRERILKERDVFAGKFGVAVSNFRPHILLGRFTQYEMKEERIVAKLKALAMGQSPFKVELEGFGSFPSHTIFINVTTKVPISMLVKSIKTKAGLMMKFDREHKPYFTSEPIINIARKLQPWQYEKGWQEYQHKNFRAKFIADQMLLLKRYQQGGAWRVVRHLEFQNLPVETVQGCCLANG